MESFLRLTLVALAAGRVTLWRLDRRSNVWTARREAHAPSWPPLDVRRVEAAGHALTWSLREELLLQVPSPRMTGGGGDGDWTLIGPVPDLHLGLAVSFRGSPPARARSALAAAVEHLASLDPGREVG